jgi:hypothetical protein
VEISDLLQALQEVENRAERVSDQHLLDTYVNAGALVGALSSRDNGIVYGRRGTGKTHALKYLAETEKRKGNFVVYIDMEQDLGSTEGLYSDPSLLVAERATRLLVDVLGIIHNKLIEDAFSDEAAGGRIEVLDEMCEHFGEIVVVNQIEQEQTTASERGAASSMKVKLNLKAPSVDLDDKTTDKSAEQVRETTTGKVRHRIHFGAMTTLLRKAFEQHPADRCWLLFDEWSGIPLDLQPYLAEMLRRIFFGLPKVTVRIAAIPHRTEWRISHSPGQYVGLELGAEVFPLLDLDEFVVFPARSRELQTQRALDFFKDLLFRHLSHALITEGKTPPESPEVLAKLLFTQTTALQEMIRAAEGVPRDALNIVKRAAVRASNSKIATGHIQSSAAQLYQTTKASLLNGNPEAQKLLDLIIQEVISSRKARAFLLLQKYTSNPLIQQLVDDRLLHLIKKGYSSKDDVGKRFDVLQIDYGCYVHLLRTGSSAPQGLLNVGLDEDSFYAAMYDDFEVPEDDYRAIRRAVLDLPSKLEQFTTS